MWFEVVLISFIWVLWEGLNMIIISQWPELSGLGTLDTDDYQKAAAFELPAIYYSDRQCFSSYVK